MKGFGFLVSALSFIVCVIIMIVFAVNMKQDMSGYLARAAHANTVELAIENLEPAVAYLEKNNLTSGFTSVLYRTPDEDIGYWYKNLRASLDELKSIDPEASMLERTNVLMKLRETLTRETSEGSSIVAPDGISRYPHNALFGFWFWISGLLAAFFFVMWVND